jgi:pyruvate dehydrogenase (quinone)/pyruvate oxidase
MATTAADILVETLIDWGVEVIFGLPGDGINGIMEALRTRQEQIRFIHVRHEESAAFMACAYAKYTGKLGVCLATSGPGGIHLLNGLYDAKLDGQPVLAITGMAFHDLVHTFTQQDVELDKLFMDVAVYNNRIMGAAHVENVTNLACRTALMYRGVAHITISTDLQDQELSKDQRSQRNVRQTETIFARGAGLPAEAALHQAAEILNGGEKIALLVGAGALGAGDEVEQVADLLGAPIIKALLGKAAVPDDSPFTTGGIGLLGTAPSEDALQTCDTLFMIGTSFPYLEFYPKNGQAKAIQLDIDPMRIGLRYPIDVGLVGDSRATLRHLIPLLQRKTGRDFLEKAQAGMQEWWQLMEERGTREDKPMKPQVLAWELGKRLRNDAIVSCDSGTNTTWWARQIPVKRGQMHSVSGNLASMANALPYAIAAQIAYPERQSIAFMGDGAFAMLMADFATAVKYNLPIKVVIVKNGTLGQIKWEQMVFLGNPEYGCDLNDIDFATFAHACGGTGFTIDDPATCGAILDQALNTPGPVVIQAVVDPHEPPMPAKIKPNQAAKFAESLAKGQPNRLKIAGTVFEDRVRELI